MRAWDFQRMVQWLAPTFILIALLSLVLVGQKRSGAGLAFFEDEAYADQAAARCLLSGDYGLGDGARAMAGRNVLWRIMLAGAGWLFRDTIAAGYFLGALFSLAALLICMRLLRLMLPFQSYVFYGAILFLAAPGVLAGALSGTALPLAAALVTGVCLLHVEGLGARGRPLPLTSALLVGLAMWIRVEFLVLWFVFWVHAHLLALISENENRSSFYVFVRGLSGLLLVALVVLPLLAWNVRLTGVPWGRALGAPLSADAWQAMPPLEVLREWLGFVRGAIPDAYVRFSGIAFLRGGAGLAASALGLLILCGLAVHREEDRPFTALLFVPASLPLLYAVVYPYAGWRSSAMVFGSVAPLLICAAAFAVFRAPILGGERYRKWKESAQAARAVTLWWAVAGGWLMLFCLYRTAAQLGERGRDLADRILARESLLAVLRPAAAPGAAIATDAPGWLAVRMGGDSIRLLDLSGWEYPQAMACLNPSGRFDRASVLDWMAAERPVCLAMWDRENDEVSAWLPTRPLLTPKSPTWPRAWRVLSPGAP